MGKRTVPSILLALLVAGCSDIPVQPDVQAASLSHTVRNQPAVHQGVAAI